MSFTIRQFNQGYERIRKVDENTLIKVIANRDNTKSVQKYLSEDPFSNDLFIDSYEDWESDNDLNDLILYNGNDFEITRYFTRSSYDLIESAASIAKTYDSMEIKQNHLLYAILISPDIKDFLESVYKLDVEILINKLEQLIEKPTQQYNGVTYISEEVMDIIEASFTIDENQDYLDPKHIFAAMIELAPGDLSEIMCDENIDLEEIRYSIINK